jgi:hypothetical protein
MFTTRPEIAGTFGVVASTHWLASSTGMAVLERGGNAFDAAVATAFVLQVAEPHLNGPGGDAPIILHDAETGKQRVICGQGPSPRAATISVFQDLGLDLIPGTGLLPAVVPGAFDAWCLLLRDWGTWEFADVLSFALGYARNGIHIVPRISATIERHAAAVRSRVESSAAVYLPGGAVPGPRTLFARPALADTWERLCRRRPGQTARPASMPPQRLVPGVRRRRGRPVFPRHRRAGRHRPPPSRPADRGRFCAVVGDGGGPGRLRLPRSYGAEMRAVEPGAGVPATTRAVAWVRHRRDGPVRRRLHSHGRGMSRNSLTPTAKLTTAIRIFAACQ